MPDLPDAAGDLAAIRGARNAAGRRLDLHWGYDLAYASACALMVASPLLPGAWGGVPIVIALALLAMLIRLWRLKTGLAVGAMQPGENRWYAIGHAILLALLWAASLLGLKAGLFWTPFITVPAAFVAAWIASRLWVRAFQRDLDTFA